MIEVAGHAEEMHIALLGVHGGLVALLAGDGSRQEGAAVVGVVARQNMFALALALDVVGQLAQAQGGIHRGGTAGGEENTIEVPGGFSGNAPGQLDLPGVDGGKRGRIAQLHDLLGHGVRDLPPAIACLHAPHTGGAVDHAPSLVIGYVDALPAHDDGRGLVLPQAGQVSPGVQ